MGPPQADQEKNQAAAGEASPDKYAPRPGSSPAEKVPSGTARKGSVPSSPALSRRWRHRSGRPFEKGNTRWPDQRKKTERPGSMPLSSRAENATEATRDAFWNKKRNHNAAGRPRLEGRPATPFFPGEMGGEAGPSPPGAESQDPDDQGLFFTDDFQGAEAPQINQIGQQEPAQEKEESRQAQGHGPIESELRFLVQGRSALVQEPTGQ